MESPRLRARRRRVLAIAGLAWSLAAPAAAQERPAAVLEAGVGVAAVLDGGAPAVVSAAARVSLTPRVSIGPGVAYFTERRGRRFLFLTGDLVVRLGPPDAVVEPYLVAGGGVQRLYERIGPFRLTHTEGTFTAGGGARIALSDTVYLVPDVRVGWEPHVRATLGLGVRLGR